MENEHAEEGGKKVLEHEERKGLLDGLEHTAGQKMAETNESIFGFFFYI
jgi:hypothetical protein